jgi:cell division septal protein FtsQ
MSPVAVSADRRFHRAHVKPGRRRAAWRSAAVGVVKYGIVLAMALLAVARINTFLTSSPLLRIDSIEPVGNQRVSSDTVREMLAGLHGENILFSDLERWRSRLLESPWIRDASFRRSLPSGIQVMVQERTPIAIARRAGRLFLVDEHGATIDTYGPQYRSLDLPIVDGFGSSKGTASADEARGALAARLVMELRQKPAVSSRLSQVDVSDVHNVTILLNDDAAQLRVGDDHFLTRVELYLSLSDTLHERVPEIDYVDLRFDGRVYVRPRGKAGQAGAANAGHPAISRVSEAQQHQ